VDIAAFDEHYNITWEPKYYKAIAYWFEIAADELRVAVEWGGDWESFPDYGHFALSREEYPA
jgi:hypothetical protein